MRCKRLGAGGMLQNAAPLPDSPKSRREAAAIIAGLVVVSAPPLVVYSGKRPPQLAWRMSHDGHAPAVFSGVPLFVPWIDSAIIEIAPAILDK